MEMFSSVKEPEKCCGNCRYYNPINTGDEPSHGVCSGPHVGQNSFLHADKDGERSLWNVTQPIVNFGTCCGHHSGGKE